VQLHGDETLTVSGVADLQPGQTIMVEATGRGGRRRLKLQAQVRLDNRQELEWFRHGGALPYILDRLLEAGQ
jgi:aconitate hydratase